jgi:hypothetical protein
MSFDGATGNAATRQALPGGRAECMWHCFVPGDQPTPHAYGMTTTCWATRAAWPMCGRQPRHHELVSGYALPAAYAGRPVPALLYVRRPDQPSRPFPLSTPLVRRSDASFYLPYSSRSFSPPSPDWNLSSTTSPSRTSSPSFCVCAITSRLRPRSLMFPPRHIGQASKIAVSALSPLLAG